MCLTDNVVVIDCPEAQYSLLQMRNRQLPTTLFRHCSDRVARSLAERVELDYRSRAEAHVILAPILRAGLALEAPFRESFLRSSVHHLGLERDEKTFNPKSYYPRRESRPIPKDQLTILLDPMNATGGSGVFAIRALRAAGASKIVFVNVIAAQEGIARVHAEFPDVTIYTVAIDPDLDDHKYIVPGLGDYGDRINGT